MSSAMSLKSARPARRSAAGRVLGVCATAAVMWKCSNAFVGPKAATVAAPTVALRATGVLERVKNPVKTVSETIADFYKAYPSPPMLPMYKTFVIDALQSTHIAMVDSRFKYDAVFALGLQEYFNMIMGTYDAMMRGAPEKEKIWKAFCASLGLEPEKVSADAAAVLGHAEATAPAQLLAQMEGTEAAPVKEVEEAFASIKGSLYSMPFSVGLFKVMEKANIELTKANVEEWAKALQITAAKASSDLDTYKLGQTKLQQAEELMREMEIRSKKKLAQQLEEKAKALAAKAEAKKEA